VQQGSEGQKFTDPGPQFWGQFVVRAERRRSSWINGFSPRNRQFGARAIGQFDQVTRLRVGRVPGPPQHITSLVVERMVGMRHTDHAAIL